MNIRLAWWVMPYVWGLVASCLFTGLRPDMDRVERMLLRGVVVEPCGPHWLVRDGIFVIGRLSIGWNFHTSREVKTFGLAASLAVDSVIATVGPLTFVWFFPEKERRP